MFVVVYPLQIINISLSVRETVLCYVNGQTCSIIVLDPVHQLP
jgi:hypothetical protein